MNEYQNYLKETYDWARDKGLVHTKKDFAEAIKTCYASMVANMNGTGHGSGSANYEKAKDWRVKIELAEAEKELAKVKEQQKELRKEQMLDYNWTEFRIETAKMFAAIMIKEGTVKGIWPDPEEVSSNAVTYVDELIKELQR